MKAYLLTLSFLVLNIFYAFTATKTWYDSANIRIESLRKGDFILKIIDADSVELKLSEHFFPFGMATLYQTNKTQDAWYKATMMRYFNACVAGNEFKWSGVESTKGVFTYAKFDSVNNWIERLGWQTRGHTLLWNGRTANYHEVPRWVQEAPSVEAMNQYCKDRIIRDVTRYKGRLKEYDVFNEPTRTTFLRSKIGDSIFWNSFKWAHEADPEAQLYVNEYNLIEWDQSAELIALIKKAKEHNAPIHGIGLQSHFDGVIDVSVIKSRLDKLATLGLQMRVTEFDMKVTEKKVSEKLQALYYARMLRLSFSYPLMTGFYFWGLLDGDVWMEGSGLYHEDKTPKIVADSVYNLIHKEWSTQVQAKPDVNGEVFFRGFYGKYQVNARINGEWRQFEVNCDTSMKGKTIELNVLNSSVPRPQFVKAVLSGPKTLEVTFDKKMTDPANEINNFAVIGKLLNSVISAELKNNDSSTVVLQLKDEFTYRNYVIVAYLKGKYLSADSGELAWFGAQDVKNNLVSYVKSATNADGSKILVNFSQLMKDPVAEKTKFKVQVNGADVEINAISLQAGNDSILVIDMKNPLSATDLIKISYTPGTLASQDNVVAPAIPLVGVTNKVLSTVIIQNLGKTAVYPNPVQDYLIVENDGTLAQMNILSIDGRELLSSSLVVGKNKIDMQKFVKGQYVVRLTKISGKETTSTVIKK